MNTDPMRVADRSQFTPLHRRKASSAIARRIAARSISRSEVEYKNRGVGFPESSLPLKKNLISHSIAGPLKVRRFRNPLPGRRTTGSWGDPVLVFLRPASRWCHDRTVPNNETGLIRPSGKLRQFACMSHLRSVSSECTWCRTSASDVCSKTS